MEDLDNPKNIYVIKRKLSELKKNGSNCYYYYVGNFIVKIFTDRVQDLKPTLFEREQEDCITKHLIVDVNLYEWMHSKQNHETRHETMIDMNKDSRFINFQPIHHNLILGIPIRTGIGMPIVNLCELIKYLHRLSNLAIFY